MSSSRFHSRRKIYFQVLLVIFVLSLIVFGYFKVDIFLTNQKITDQRALLEQQTQELDAYKVLTGYNKLQAVKILEEQQTTMPWSDHISDMIDMLQDMKSIDTSATDTIALSDFNVTLDKITLKGQVSNLLLLYYSNPNRNMVSLIDRFSDLEFVKNIRIQTYDRVSESNYYEFVLEANVINDGTTDNTTE